jgi:hypothetical protein
VVNALLTPGHRVVQRAVTVRLGNKLDGGGGAPQRTWPTGIESTSSFHLVSGVLRMPSRFFIRPLTYDVCTRYNCDPTKRSGMSDES